MGYIIYDNQLKEEKQGFPVFKSAEQAYDYYGDSLLDQIKDGDFTDKEIKELEESGIAEIFEVMGYSVEEM